MCFTLNTHQAALSVKCGKMAAFTLRRSVTQSERWKQRATGKKKKKEEGEKEEESEGEGESWAGVKVISLVGWR